MKKNWKEACEFIAQAWNESLPPEKAETSKLIGKDIFELHPGGELFFIPILYEAAENGTLIGLILHYEFIAKLFTLKLRSKGVKI